MLSGKNFGDVDFAVGATASSSLTVAFAASGNCSVAAITAHLTGAGSCTVTASQAGDGNTIPRRCATIVCNCQGQSDDYVRYVVEQEFWRCGLCGQRDCVFQLGRNVRRYRQLQRSRIHGYLTGAGSCTITASQVGDSNYNLAPDVPQSLTISKAVPLVTLSCPPAGFDINPHACTAPVTGLGNVTVSGATTVTYNSNPAPPANAGTYGVSASFTSGDGNYTDATGSGSLVIAKAAPTVTVVCPGGIVFSGSPHACTAAAAGLGNAAVSGSAVLTYSGGPAPSAGGTYAVSASFTSGDSNYADDTGTGSLTIARAGQTITFAVLATKTLGDPDFAVSATASSSLGVSSPLPAIAA